MRQPDFIIVGGAASGGGSGAGCKPFQETPSGVVNGVNKTFTLSFTPWLGYTWLYLNGVKQRWFGAPEYTLAGNVITYAIAPKATYWHEIWYCKGPAAMTTGTARAFGDPQGVGSSDSVNWGNNAIYNLLADMAFAGWFKPSSSSSGYIVFRGIGDVSVLQPGNDAFRLQPSISGGKCNLTYAHQYSNAQPESHGFATQLTLDEWVFAAFVRDSVAKTIKVYTGDGTSVSLFGSANYTNQPDGGTDPACQLVIGNTDSGSPNIVLNGGVQEHYVWGRTLTLAELQQAMAGNPPTSALLLSSTMGKTPEIDNSPTGSTGTVTGTSLIPGHS